MTQTDLDSALTSMQDQLFDEARRTFSPQVIYHWRHPCNPGRLANADGEAWIKGGCNDTLGIFLRVKGGQVIEASFVTDGCGASIAVGSMAVTLAQGETLEAVRAISAEQITEELGGLPADHAHCAMLAAETLRAAVDNCFEGRDPLASAQ